ncbi:S-adenosyl-L-methionine-dependent methyltransferase [Cercophora newfieldiana]|uniref:S-adenosyl-L-methionine-dependent methyltransferase n=1 Tax=Cercophora newfieldiana TaxID=92897 RepID=A0AA39Y013_9PEZI|nr:S-adenosyl-L-methionine-dependent methyltransferase [Cercophora newfieldiana]
MGRGGKFKKNRGGGRGGGRGAGANGERAPHRPYQTFPEVPKENEKFERYYKGMLNLPEEEQAEFWAALRRELPNSFRFCGSKGHALEVRKLLQKRYIPEITRITHDGILVEAPKEVPWYPDSLAWWMTTPKNVVRKFPPFSKFQKFLVSETSVGNISRQEVVSMIPPLLMDLKPGMTVLDLCAAPGSKSAQLLEMVHRGEEARIRQVVRAITSDANGADKTEVEQEDEAARLEADPSDDGRATGMLIANDADYKRSHMLIHQLKRLSSPNMIVTNHDATMYPPIRIPNPEDPYKPKYLKFDRILADVPCSGDGTLRKNANLWKDWTPGNALGLHITQVRILVRALQMLKPGGRVVYSTCSMNPMENESVVAAAIDRCGGPDKIEIIDCRDQLPLLKRKPGLKKWQIMDKSGRVWNTWKEVEEYTKSGGEKGGPAVAPSRIAKTMFPIEEGSDCYDLPLDRCMRVYAHQQDTGGFFITALHKKAEFKAKPEEVEKKETVKKPVAATNGAANGSSGATDAVETIGAAAAKRGLEEEQVEEPEVKKRRVSQDDTASPLEDAAAASEPEFAPIPDAVETVPEAKAEEVETPAESDTPMADADATETPAETPKPETTSTDTPKPGQHEKKKKQQGPYEEPFKFLSAENPVIQNVTEFYKISDRFPRDRYMVRNAMGEPAKSIYYTSALVRDILTLNEGRGVKFVHGGVKMFVKQDSPSAEVCCWRIQSEGMPILHGYVGEDRVVVLRKKETLKKLLIEMFPKIANGEWARLDEIGERVRDLGLGCCVLRIEPEGDDEYFNETMALPLWKSFHSLNLMLPKEDRSAMLLRIYNDTTPLVNMGIRKDEKKEEQQPVVATEAEAVVEAAEAKGEDTVMGEDTSETKEGGAAPKEDEKVPVENEAPVA